MTHYHPLSLIEFPVSCSHYFVSVSFFFSVAVCNIILPSFDSLSPLPIYHSITPPPPHCCIPHLPVICGINVFMKINVLLSCTIDGGHSLYLKFIVCMFFFGYSLTLIPQWYLGWRGYALNLQLFQSITTPTSDALLHLHP